MRPLYIQLLHSEPIISVGRPGGAGCRPPHAANPRQESRLATPCPGASPDVRTAISHNGTLVSSVRPSLPAAEADGSVRVVSRIPFSGLDPGVYEIAVTAAQGGATGRRAMAIEVE